MSQQKLLKKVIGVLQDLGIEYMVTGSIVSSLQGEPRATHDLDLVVKLERDNATQLTFAFTPPRFYLDRDSIIEAIKNENMFNLIDSETGYKVDFWILTKDDFDRSRFKRRYYEDFMGLKICLSSPEDTILAKLRWAKLSGGSEKQLTDALRIFEVQYQGLDHEYIKTWIERLQIQKLWLTLKERAMIVD